MNNNTEIIFSDKTVTYDQFVTDLATRIALKIHQVEKVSLKSARPKRSRCLVGQMLNGGLGMVS